MNKKLYIVHRADPGGGTHPPAAPEDESEVGALSNPERFVQSSFDLEALLDEEEDDHA